MKLYLVKEEERLVWVAALACGSTADGRGVGQLDEIEDADALALRRADAKPLADALSIAAGFSP